MDTKDKGQFKDYRFDMLAYSLRKENVECYSFSRQATWQLFGNDSSSSEFDEKIWDEFWKVLHDDYKERFLQ